MPIFIIDNIINYTSSIFNSFVSFIVENNLISLFMAALFAYALNGLINSLKTNIIEYYLNKLFKTSNNNLINLFISFLQFLLIITIIYFFYTYVLRKIADKYKNNKSKFNDNLWKENILLELKDINNKIK